MPDDIKSAVVFQGQTYPFREEYANSRYVRKNLNRFQEYSSVNLKGICEGTVKYSPHLKTMYEQPAIMAVELLRAREEENRQYIAFLGHSFGEWVALRASSVIKSDEEAMFGAETRSQFMAEANVRHPGAMAAVVGRIDMHSIQDVCDRNKIYIANINVPDEQVVVSGRRRGVERASNTFTRMGFRIFPVDIGGAFHCEEMRDAEHRWRESLGQISFHPPRPESSLIMISSGKSETDPEIIKECVISQLTHPIYFADAVSTLISDLDVENIREPSNKKTLTGFIRKIKNKLLKK